MCTLSTRPSVCLHDMILHEEAVTDVSCEIKYEVTTTWPFSHFILAEWLNSEVNFLESPNYTTLHLIKYISRTNVLLLATRKLKKEL